MATLASLKLTATQKPIAIPAIQVRRNKLAKRLWEQMELAKAQHTGKTFSPTKFRTVRDTDTGISKQIEVNKRVKQWWFATENGKLALSVRYGAKLLELAKGKYSVELTSVTELVPTLEVIKSAVLNGELDLAIDSASIRLREGFKR